MGHVNTTFVDINHRVAPLWMLYSVTLIFIYEVKHFLVIHLLYKNRKQRMSPAYESGLVRYTPWNCSCIERLSLYRIVQRHGQTSLDVCAGANNVQVMYTCLQVAAWIVSRNPCGAVHSCRQGIIPSKPPVSR